MTGQKEKTYEVFGFDRVEQRAVVTSIEGQFEAAYITIGFPTRENLVGYCAGIEMGKFCIKSDENGDRPIIFFTYSEIKDLYEAIPQIIADNMPEPKTDE